MSITGSLKPALFGAIRGPTADGSLPWQEGGAKAPSWTPAKLSPDAWWRADNVVITGSGVSTLTDLSGNGYHLTQGTDANRPVISAADADYGAQDVMTFNGIAQKLAGGDVLNPGSGDLTVIVIGEAVSSAAVQVFLSKGPTSGDGWQMAIKSDSGLARIYADGATAAVVDAQAGATAATPGLLRGEVDAGTGVTAFVEGTGLVTATDPGAITNASVVTMGDDASGGRLLSGEIAESIVLLRIPSAAELAELLPYANDRYAKAFAGA